MSDYLTRRNGRYYYRRRYPIDIATILGKTEFVQALGTADPTEAARLSRRVSVQFDDACAEALHKVENASPVPPVIQAEGGDPRTDSEAAEAVIARLPTNIRTLIDSIISEAVKNPRGWKDDIAWRRRALEAHLSGQMPASIQMHPLQAQADLKTLDDLEAGLPSTWESNRPTVPQKATTTPAMQSGSITEIGFNAAFDEYKHGKSEQRIRMIYRISRKVLVFPCTQNQAREALQEWCGLELQRGKSANAIRTELSGVVAALKHHAGWESFVLPKTGNAKALVGAGIAKKGARAPMPVKVISQVLLNLPANLPKNGMHWHAAAILLALYGMRPREILMASVDSLSIYKDIFGHETLTFSVGDNGAKNESSKRSLPVPLDLEPVFRLALSKGSCTSSAARVRVDRLSNMVKKSLPEGNANLSLYGLRHTFADVARSCGYSEEEFGPLLGHASKAGITRVYGGNEALTKASKIFNDVKVKLFPQGLNSFLPASIPKI